MLPISAGNAQSFSYTVEIKIMRLKTMNFQSFFSKSIFFNNFIYFESEMWCDLILGAWVLCPVK